MSERALDVKATAAARDRHQAGQERLNEIFGWTVEDARIRALQRRYWFPFAERARRRKRAKAQRIARKVNRP